MRFSPESLTIVSVFFATRWLLTSAGSGQKQGTQTRFPGSLGVRLLCSFVGPTALYGAITVLRSHDKPAWWVSLVLLALTGSALWLWPREIVTTSQGISQRKILGRTGKQFLWNDVEYAHDNSLNGNVEVVTKSGEKILHTPMHVGHLDFLQIVKRHCRIW